MMSDILEGLSLGGRGGFIPQEIFTMSEGMSGWLQLRREVHLDRGYDAAKHPTMPRPAPPHRHEKKLSAPRCQEC